MSRAAGSSKVHAAADKVTQTPPPGVMQEACLNTRDVIEPPPRLTVSFMAVIKLRWVPAILCSLFASLSIAFAHSEEMGTGSEPSKCLAPLLPNTRDDDPARVKVVHPVEREVQDFFEFQGRIQSSAQVDLRPRVSGQLVRTFFKEGGEVKRGDLLFQVDPRPFQEELNRSLRQLTERKLEAEKARMVIDRDRALEAKQPGSVSKAQLDLEEAEAKRTLAALANAEKAVELAKANLLLTRMHSPMDGLILLKLADPGRVLIADKTHMGTIVSREPVHVFFNTDVATCARIQLAIRARKPGPEAEFIVELRRADDEDLRCTGKLNIPDLKGLPNNSTIQLRATFTKPISGRGTPLLLPGMRVSLCVPVDGPVKSLVIPFAALIEQKGKPAVFVADSADRVQVRRVSPGLVLKDGNTAIRDGIMKTDWILLEHPDGIQPGTLIRPDRIAYPGKNEAPCP